jgi:type IV pilus assembly protein PilC
MLDTLAITATSRATVSTARCGARFTPSVKQGKKITAPLQKTKLLPRAVSQMISAGEESGKLGEVLDEISGLLLQAA